jgi:inositol-phosphate phosphatase/L-galactose 1-phosphate phosphatase/histidinol-phosphatase
MSEFLTFAHQLADAAGAAIRPYFGAHGEVEAKDDNSPVTLADKLAEKAIRTLIDRHYPDHAIYGEEDGQKKTISEYCWVIDPIDGTRAFIAGRKEWGTLIALCADGVPILGILDQPITGERWVGVKGKPTTYSSAPANQPDPTARSPEVTIRTRPCPTLAEAELSTTSANYFTPEQATHVVAIAQQVRATVKDGDCYAYGLLARGMRDVVIDAGLKPYDILALVPIIEGAGGKITSWDGEAVTLRNFKDVVAVGDAGLHSQTLPR